MPARDYGWITDRFATGPANAITDVDGIRVGHSTIVEGMGKLIPGKGPVRTGVTAIMLPGNPYDDPIRANVHVINGFGKSVGLVQVAELGQLETPILLTGTLSAFRVADFLIDYMIETNPGIGINRPTVNPVVLECSDAYLNDIQGRHVTGEHVREAIVNARGKEIPQGSVGAGTGMVSFGFKAGIGSASRMVSDYVVGVLVLANYGKRRDLCIKGVNVGRHLPSAKASQQKDDGSIIVIVATDAPLTERQLGRMARRTVVGLVRPGGHIDHGSGEIALAFSTSKDSGRIADKDKLFTELCRSMVAATEEAVFNSLADQTDMVGRDGNVVNALPIDRVNELTGEVGHDE